MAPIQRLLDKERHLEGIARDGFVSAALPIAFGGVVLAVCALVGLVVALALAVSSGV